MITLMLDAADPTTVEIAANLLREGQLVAVPTETVYGCAAAITNEQALQNIFLVKGRPQDNPLIVHVASVEQVEDVAVVDDVSRRLMQAFFPGPLTLVLPALPHVSSTVTAGLGTVAVRMPDSAVTCAIIRATGSALAAPSANRSGRPSPTTAQHVLDDLGGSIAAIVDAGPCREGLESTVVRCTSSGVVLLRPGACTRAAIEAVLGTSLLEPATGDDSRHSPGTRYRHYAPSAEVILVSTVAEARAHCTPDHSAMILATSDPQLGIPWRPLLPTTLYAELRRADTLHVEKIIVHCDKQVRSNEALMNRLRKAAEPRKDDR